MANTMVERCASTRSAMRSSTCGQIDSRCGSPAAGPPRSPVGVPSSAMSSTGTTTSTSIVFCDAGCTTSTSRVAHRNRATSSTGRTVADSPIRCAGRGSSRSSRSRLSARCAPRLVPATACTSSTITVSTPRSASRAEDVSSRNSDSGVVMRTSGGRPARRRRSSAGVSPVRIPTVTSGTGSPIRAAACRMPGERPAQVALHVDRQRLERGDVQHPAPEPGVVGGGRLAIRSRDHRNAASVLPEPVGATTRASRPRWTADQAPVWAAVGAANAPSNHARVAGEKAASAPDGSEGAGSVRRSGFGGHRRPSCRPAPTPGQAAP